MKAMRSKGVKLALLVLGGEIRQVKLIGAHRKRTFHRLSRYLGFKPMSGRRRKREE